MGTTACQIPGVTRTRTANRHLGAVKQGGSGAQYYAIEESTNIFVVKLKGTAQGIRVLFNEYVSGRIGELLGVPFGEHAIIQVSDVLHPRDGEPNVKSRRPGLQFGTVRYEHGQTDFSQLKNAVNFDRFPSVLVFDAFIARGNSRQYHVVPSSGNPSDPKDTGVIFDQGFAFTGNPMWSTQSLQQQRGCTVNDGRLVLKQSFPAIGAYEIFIQCIEMMNANVIKRIVEEAPLREWEVSEEEAEHLVRWLDARRLQVRGAIQDYLR